MPTPPIDPLPLDEFRKRGYAMVDWIADYYARVTEFPVLSQVAPGDVYDALPAHPPETGEPFEAVMADVERIILPGITHWQSPNFFAYFPTSTSMPGILGEMMSAGLGVQGMIWATSPACTELETRVMDWLVELLGLPEAFSSQTRGGGVIQDTASSAVLSALLAGREQATQFNSNEKGCDGRLTVYVSTQAHSSVEKAAKIAGIGRQQVRLIPVDDNLAMDPQALQRQIQADKAAGMVPCFVCATVGTTSTTALDPIPEIGAVCEAGQIWLHVDGAMAGTAALCPEYRYIQNGLEYADSYCFNPHKWMLANFDCSCFFVRDRHALTETLAILPEYLKNEATASGAVFDYRDWHVQLGRRFRALKLWFVIREYGAEGLQRFVKHHIEAAHAFKEWVEAHPDFELAAPAPVNLVCFRHVRGDAFSQRLLETLNANGRIYLTHTKVAGKYVLRLSVGQSHTRLEHVAAAWEEIVRTADEL